MAGKTKVDLALVRADHAAGMTISELAAKYKINKATVYNYLAKLAARSASAKLKPQPLAPITIVATSELVDGIWATLPLTKKAALINKLPEVS